MTRRTRGWEPPPGRRFYGGKGARQRRGSSLAEPSPVFIGRVVAGRGESPPPACRSSGVENSFRLDIERRLREDGGAWPAGGRPLQARRTRT